ncbi:tyrosine--tRNA ligase [Candidatus Sumerlaeota bacterium]|nr:tyrosine--tRNA ligase [Candidatus Sumerlaeota bacterium]
MSEDDAVGLMEELQARGFIAQTTAPQEELEKFFAEAPRTVYCGFDPTAESLHVGNLVPIIGLRHFQRAGHRPIVVMGGATGMVGDPSGKSSERNLLMADQIERNLAGQRVQFERLLDFSGANPAMIVNNYDWMKNFTLIDFLRDVGKHFRMGEMLSKDSVKSRLDGEGMSFTEFSYQLLQGYDFLHLWEQEQCTAQLGGSDQWGNIVAGTELIRRKHGSASNSFGVTFPLLTTATGEKFGKSAGNAVWLDPEKTSPYQYYQYFIRADDRDVERLLLLLTFLPIEEIKAAAQAHTETPHQREGQRLLAREMTRWAHGEAGLAKAEQASQALFGGSIDGLSDADLNDIFADVPSTAIAKAELEAGIPLIQLLADSGLCKSKGEARKLIQNGGAYVNNNKQTDIQAALNLGHLASESMLVLRSGKKNYCLVRCE